MTARSDPFAVPGAEWSRVSPRLATLRRLVLAVGTVVVVAGLVAIAALVSSWRPFALGGIVLALVLAVYSWWLVGRSVAAWGWVERDGDIVVTRGRWWRRIDVVPYGRMQLVDVTSTPFERWYDVTTVRMHTASPSSRARLPGLPPEVARRLRDRLTERGEALAAGL